MYLGLVVKVGLYRAIFFVGSALYVLTVSKLLAVEEAGIYFTYYGYFLFGSMLSRFGMDRGLVRYIPLATSSLEKMSIFKSYVERSALFTIGVAIVFLFLHIVFGKGERWPLVIVLCLSSFFFNASLLVAAFLKGDKKPLLACSFESGAISLICCLFLVLWTIVLGEIGLFEVATIFLLSCMTTAFTSIALISYKNRVSPLRVSNNKISQELTLTLNSYGRIAILGHLNKFFPIVVIGYFYLDSDVALYKIAEQVSVIPGFVLVVISSIFSPRFSSEWAQHNLDKTKSLFVNSILISIALGVIGCLFVYFISDVILAFLDPSYKEAHEMLSILLFATFINVASGPVIAILTMTGAERKVEMLLYLSALASVPLYLLSGIFNDVLYVAVATLIIVMIQNLGGLFFLQRQFK
ncbi:hypothetical protein A3732_08350 [Oleiphilus sp. HI0050]|nr:hypothetical protein A3732_08350 [Oleiphilus sp. HI0050]